MYRPPENAYSPFANIHIKCGENILRCFDPDKWLKSIKVKPLKCPKPRVSRKIEAIQADIEKSVLGYQKADKYIGLQFNNQVIKATDGYRCLLVNPDPWTEYPNIKLPDPGRDKITITDPEFYNAIRRISIASSDLIFSYNPETWELKISAGGEQVKASETLQLISKHQPAAGKFSVDSKLLLPCLGSWPVSIYYESGNPDKPLLWSFQDYSVLIMPLKWDKALEKTA